MKIQLSDILCYSKESKPSKVTLVDMLYTAYTCPTLIPCPYSYLLQLPSFSENHWRLGCQEWKYEKINDRLMRPGEIHEEWNSQGWIV